VITDKRNHELRPRPLRENKFNSFGKWANGQDL
jgi:hypothetical protein